MNQLPIRLVMSLSGLLTVLFILSACFDEPNTIAFLKYHYGADDETIEALAKEYSVEVSAIPTFGYQPFPVNYLRRQIGWDGNSYRPPLVYRRDVDPMIKGYVAKCVRGVTTTLYLFYSDRLAPRLIFSRDTSALVMEVRYVLDTTIDEAHDDQILEDIRYFDLGDDAPFNWVEVAAGCTPKART